LLNPEIAEQYTVLIPAAGENTSLIPLVGGASPALAPLDGRPLIFWTIQYLHEVCGITQFVVAHRAKDRLIRRLVTQAFGDTIDLKFVIPDKEAGVGYTLLCCHEQVSTPLVMVVLGDTYFTFPEDAGMALTRPFLLTPKSRETYRWCVVETDSEGLVNCLIDKPSDRNGASTIAIGVYGGMNWDRFRSSMFAAWEEANGSSNECGILEMSAILNRYRHFEAILSIPSAEWFDCGNLDNFIQSRKAFAKARAFNSLTFDDTIGTVTKKSKNGEKFQEEIQYYEKLPSKIKSFFPRIVESSTKNPTPFLTMEYYGYPTLSELFVFRSLDPIIWRSILTHLYDIVNIFMSHSRHPSPEIYQSMYVSRVKDRVNNLLQYESLGELVQMEHVLLNGKPLKGFWPAWKILEPMIVEMLMNDDEHCIIHGDMCFSNILYDLPGKVCRFIDPRGSFGKPGIWGDIKYDIAKMYHSIDGRYDYIINDFFVLNQSGDSFKLEVFSSEENSSLKEDFEAIFFKKFDSVKIKLIESILFLTMGQFHYDNRKRQTAMFLTGLSLLNEVLSNLEEKNENLLGS